MEKRTETRANNFGVVYLLGEKFDLYKVFSSQKIGTCEIVHISPSGNFFKVSGSDKVFSTKTLHSNGSTIVTGYYLVHQL